MTEDILRGQAISFADKIDSSVSARSALIYFAEELSRRFYLVSKNDADRLYQGYNDFQGGWSSNADFVSDLEKLIPELTEE